MANTDFDSGVHGPSGSSLPAPGHLRSKSNAISDAEHAASPATDFRIVDSASDGDSASVAANDACDGLATESGDPRAEADKTGEATASGANKQPEAIAEGPSTVSKRKRGRPRKPEAEKTKKPEAEKAKKPEAEKTRKQAKCCNHASTAATTDGTISAVDATVADVCAPAARANGEDPESLVG